MGENDQVIIPKDAIEEIQADIEIVRAIEILEYHDRVHLTGSPGSRYVVKIKTLTKALETIIANIRIHDAK